MIAADTDDALDEVLLTRRRDADRAADATEEPRDDVVGVRRRELRRRLERRVLAVEHHDLAAMNRARVVDELVDEHPVADVQGVFHRLGRDVERLHEKRLDEQREHKGDRDEDR